ncbi:unnamed protein product [Enterobius vermicularis]|uniref:Uncharacterized protein n=1 Tax=Enterobius vermicularis TaxID=51028 RepID=A0A0N4UZT3_ENTVE|nr:unnamed protein product [Enterobius vermicularis]
MFDCVFYEDALDSISGRLLRSSVSSMSCGMTERVLSGGLMRQTGGLNEGTEAALGCDDLLCGVLGRVRVRDVLNGFFGDLQV